VVRRRQKVVCGVTATLLCAVMAGCDSGAVAPTSPPAMPTRHDESGLRPGGEPSATAGDNATQQAVLAAYQGYWDAILAANDPPDPSHPALRRYATGAAYESVIKATHTNRLARRAVRLPPNSISTHRAQVVSIQGDTATVRDCAIDDGLVVDMDTGGVVNDVVATQLRTATLLRESGVWKVANTVLEQRWEGVAGCAHEPR
jgi:hypothetical protein